MFGMVDVWKTVLLHFRFFFLSVAFFKRRQSYSNLFILSP